MFVATFLSCCLTGGRGQVFPEDEGPDIVDTQTFDNFMELCLDKGQVAAFSQEKELQCYNLNTQVNIEIFSKN